MRGKRLSERTMSHAKLHRPANPDDGPGFAACTSSPPTFFATPSLPSTLMNGGDLVTLLRVLGHKSLEVTKPVLEPDKRTGAAPLRLVFTCGQEAAGGLRRFGDKRLLETASHPWRRMTRGSIMAWPRCVSSVASHPRE